MLVILVKTHLMSDKIVELVVLDILLTQLSITSRYKYEGFITKLSHEQYFSLKKGIKWVKTEVKAITTRKDIYENISSTNYQHL